MAWCSIDFSLLSSKLTSNFFQTTTKRHDEIQSAAMQLYCTPCKRGFSDKQALDQHSRDSPAHISIVDCQPCNRSFLNQDALDQHLRDSPAHKITFPCIACDRSFVNQDALDQHLQFSSAHAPTFNCEPKISFWIVLMSST